MKIIDKIRRAVESGEIFYSFEYFPPKTKRGLDNLLARIERMGRLNPLFIDVTWGTGGSTADVTLDICNYTQNLTELETMMHLTCTNMSRAELAEMLNRARANGIQNILALRGDPPAGTGKWRSHDDGFKYASDLVRFIREEHGDYFGIAVAGYPGGHIEAPSYEEDLLHLKEKVEAGADFIVTQLFYDSELFFDFKERCRRVGIDVPILPGVMPIHSYHSFRKITKFIKDIPQRVRDDVERLKEDDEAIKNYGIELITDLCRTLIEGGVEGIHFYTMNLEKRVRRILDELQLVPSESKREMPWRRSANERRWTEEVRPIFWANRPKSYLAQTMKWEHYPRGRWGDFELPPFKKDNFPKDFTHSYPQQCKDIWSRPLESFEDIKGFFVDFCEGRIDCTPWFDEPFSPESNRIKEQLITLNRRGLLTINSQPVVHGESSDSEDVGWGDSGGFVYQKAYIEFFISEEEISLLLEVLKDYPQLTYHAINDEGKSYKNSDQINGVTWGVFSGKEIVQPTIVDPRVFEIWKDEAFDIWLSIWGALHEEGSLSYRLLKEVHDTFYLVNIVDNDLINSKLWLFFEDYFRRSEARKAEKG